MAELVGGAFLSSFLQVAFERLTSRDFLDYFRRRKLDDGLLRKLRVILLSVDKIVEDAEERQYRDHRVKQWLDELKHEVFNAQDLLDDIATEALRQKLDAESQTAASGKVRGFFTSLVNRNQSEKKIESGIKEVINNLENLLKQNEILGLREVPSAGIQLGVNRKVYERWPTTRLIDESDMCGRDADKERIVEVLLSQSTGGNQLPMDVIAITGMGGMGKTTLARLVYEDGRMKDQFQHRAWVCVSEEFDVDRVTKEIFCSLSCPRDESDDLHSRQRKIKETLMGKKFFLVLDDVWNENCKIWEVFQAPLKHAAPQSKILLTTRNQKVAEVMCCTFTHSLKPLEDGDVWNLFAKHAFNNQRHNADPDLLQIGRKIVKRCGGLPLAIKTLGSLLHRKLSFQYWDKILKSEFWELSENESNIVPSLRLSYHYLPSNLKRCFAYCSIFPKDYNIDKNVLIQLWMADGLIDPPQKSMSLEEAGNEMFNDLESRSFFEPSRKGDGYFVMHDLVNDLAKSVTKEFFVQQEVDQGQVMSTKTRYFSLTSKMNGNIKISDEVFKCHRLRAFLLLDKGVNHSCYLDVDIMSRLSRLKYMRQLSLSGCRSFKILTEGIGNLKHLHYLDLSWTSVEELPNSMCLLINLQTLKLRGCKKLTKLPSNFYKLVNLRHLDLEGCGINEMPKHMGNILPNLVSLVLCRCPNIGSLPPLGQLPSLQKLTIEGLHGIKVIGEEFNGNGSSIAPFPRLSYLSFENMSEWEEWDICYEGESFPNLVSLVLKDCPNIESLPPLGQLPSLQKLTISGLNGIKVIGEEFYGNGSSITPFPCLSYLKFYNMGKWEEWDICHEGESFPCLEQLHISICHSLKKSLPQHLPCLKALDIWGCRNLEATLPKSSCMEKLSLQICGKITVKDMPTWSSSDVLPPLHDLKLYDCRAMESLPQGGMLSSLQRLSIQWCSSKVIESGRDWGLHELLSLKQLQIVGLKDMECFPEEGLLPPNLQSLLFTGCLNMKRINHRGLVHLHSLTSLSFIDCPSMSFEGMPEDGLPPSLSRLLIYGDCPLLEKRCEKEKGPDWPIIAHIPHIHIM